MVLLKQTQPFSTKEQLLPALAVLPPWPLLCADSRADFVYGCSHAEWGEQEELCRTAGLCLLLLWLWFNHCRATLYPGTLKEERNVLAPFPLMELKAKGVFVQRGDHQPLNVGSSSSSSKPHLTIHSPLTGISKWPPLCACSSRVFTQGPDRARFASVGAADHTYCLFFLARAEVEKFSGLHFWMWFIFSFSGLN